MLLFPLIGLPGVLWVLPDSYIDVKNKDYGGMFHYRQLRRGSSIWSSYSSVGIKSVVWQTTHLIVVRIQITPKKLESF